MVGEITKDPTYGLDPPLFQCSICHELFVGHGALKRHRRSIHPGLRKDYNLSANLENPKSCMPVSTKEKLISHQEGQRYGFFTCHVCEHKPSFRKLKKFIQHCSQTVGHTPIDYDVGQCPCCNEEASLTHLQHQHWYLLPYICSECRLGFVHSSHYQIHLLTHRPNKNHCSSCDIHFACQEGILNHVKVMHLEQSSLKCPSCLEQFSRQMLLDQHTCPSHEEHCCSDCEVILPTAALLYDHWYKRHGRLHDYPCDYCAQGFDVERWLVNHERWHHSISRCLLCNEKVEMTIEAWQEHQKSHEQDLNYCKCPSCHTVFTTLSDFHFHNCYLTWNLGTDYQENVQVQCSRFKWFNGTTELSCPLCNRLFDTIPMLMAHIPLHGDNLFFECPECPKVMSSSDELMNSHFRLVHKELAFDLLCQECNLFCFTQEEKNAHTCVSTEKSNDPLKCPNPKCDHQSISLEEAKHHECLIPWFSRKKKSCLITENETLSSDLDDESTLLNLDPLSSTTLDDIWARIQVQHGEMTLDAVDAKIEQEDTLVMRLVLAESDDDSSPL
jgi:hypothetical protein